MVILLSILAGLTALVLMHHLLYPACMMMLALLIKQKRPDKIGEDERELPSLHMVIPAFNEAGYIADKIRSISKCVYPCDRLTVTVLNDGSKDQTAQITREMQVEYPDLNIELVDDGLNMGKLARLNAYLPGIDADVIILSDASALLDQHSLKKVGEWFSDGTTGVVAGGYGLSHDASFMQRFYWKMQSLTKQGENRLGALIGAHGAFYAIRSDLFSPLKPGTINDDFVIPMQAAYHSETRMVYDPSIQIFEADVDGERQDLNRRLRIGAGNFQQIQLLAKGLISKPLSITSLCFFFSKILRVAMGPCLVMIAALMAALPILDPAFMLPVALFFGSILMSFYPNILPSPLNKIAKIGHYVLSGHLYSMIGVIRYVFGRDVAWNSEPKKTVRHLRQPITHKIKRSVDFTAALFALVLLSPLVPLLALLIKIDSPGPVIFKQSRIGRACPDRTDIFDMYKFRSMRQDAEKAGAPQWAQKKDPRVTRIGRVLRKTRLDELPQLVNVLKGDMSLIGPRPERPGFYQTLEEAIPYFAERTYWVRPGITGLAQTQQGYTETVEEARTKALYDHVYALKTLRFRDWLRTDTKIVWDTIAVMALGRGR